MNQSPQYSLSAANITTTAPMMGGKLVRKDRGLYQSSHKPSLLTTLVFFTPAVLLCLLVLCALPVSSSIDRIKDLSPFDFYTNLEGSDKWFDETTNEDMGRYWTQNQDIDIVKRLQQAATFSYSTTIHLHMVGLGLQDDQRPRLTVADSDLEGILDQTKRTMVTKPLAWAPKLHRVVDYAVLPSSDQFSKDISALLSQQAQVQLESTIKWIRDSRSTVVLTRDMILQSLIFRLSPAPLDDLVLNHLTKNHQIYVEKFHLLYLAHTPPKVKFNNEMLPVSYVFTHFPKDIVTPDVLSMKPSPRFDFNQHSIPASYRPRDKKTPQNPNSSGIPQSTTVFDRSKSIPVVWIDLTAEQMTFHALPVQDIPTLELVLPSYLLTNYVASGTSLFELQQSSRLMDKVKRQFLLRLVSVAKHITNSIFLSNFISKAPLLTLSTKVTIIHIAEHYTAENLNLVKETQSPNQFKTLSQQIQGIAPKGYIVDVDIVPVSLSSCGLCLNSINNAIRSDPAHVMGGIDGRYIDSGTLFDLFEQWNIDQWSPKSKDHVISYKHYNDGTIDGQFLTFGGGNERSGKVEYQRNIVLWAIEPDPAFQQKNQATFLFDKVYQTVANSDKTRIISIMNALPPVSLPMLSQLPNPTTTILTRDSTSNTNLLGGPITDINNHLTTPQLSLYSTLVSVVYGYGSSKSVVFPGGGPVVDSMFVLEGTHPPYSNKPSPTPFGSIPSLTVTSSTTMANVEHFNAQMLIADVLNTIETTMTTIHDYKLDMSLVPEEGLNNIFIRIEMLSYKLKQVGLVLSTVITARFPTPQAASKPSSSSSTSSFSNLSSSISSMDLAYGYLYSARHDIGWLLLYFHNLVQKQEPVTICSQDVAQHTATVHGLTDLIHHYWTSTVTPVLEEYVLSEEDQQNARAQRLNTAHLNKGHLGLDSDINNYIKEQQGGLFGSSASYWVFAIDVFLVVVVVCFCCLCCVLGRKRRKEAIDMVTEAFSSSGSSSSSTNLGSSTQRAGVMHNNMSFGGSPDGF